MLQRDFRTATSLLELVLQQEPNHAQAHLLLGIAYARQRKSSQAATHYRRYLELEPRGPQADMVRDMLEGQARR